MSVPPEPSLERRKVDSWSRPGGCDPCGDNERLSIPPLDNAMVRTLLLTQYAEVAFTLNRSIVSPGANPVITLVGVVVPSILSVSWLPLESKIIGPVPAA